MTDYELFCAVLENAYDEALTDKLNDRLRPHLDAAIAPLVPSKLVRDDMLFFAFTFAWSDPRAEMLEGYRLVLLELVTACADRYLAGDWTDDTQTKMAAWYGG